MKKCLSLVLSLLFLLTAVPVSAADVSEYQIFDVTVAVEENYDEIAAEIVILNQEREANGLSPLVLDAQLTAYAMQRAAECTIYYSHTRPNGSSCFTVMEGKYVYYGAGENIAIGQRSAQEVMVDWMNSSGHRANILNANFASVGLGCVETVDGTKVWVQLFSGASGTSYTPPSGTVYRERVPVSVYNTLIYCWWILEKEELWLVGDTVSGGLLNPTGDFPYSATLITGGFTVTSSSDCVRVNADGTMTAVSEGEATITATMGSGGGQVSTSTTVTVRKPVSLTYQWEADGALTVSWDGAQPDDVLVCASVEYGSTQTYAIGGQKSLTIRNLSRSSTYTIGMKDSTQNHLVSNEISVSTYPTDHVFDDDTDVVCNDCGFVRVSPLLSYFIYGSDAQISGFTDAAVHIDLPAGILGRPVTTVLRDAFDGCTTLKTLYIPKSITRIDSYAFANSAALTDVYYEGSEEDFANLYIGDGNEVLTSATWHFNSIPTPEPDVPTVVPGDANGDGSVNNRDLGLLQRYLNGWGTEIDTAAMDVTGDGSVNNRDLGQLQRYLNDWGVVLD